MYPAQSPIHPSGARTVRTLNDRSIQWLDFDTLLADVPHKLGDAAGHFGIAASADDLTRIMSGPILRRYSKAMEHEYSPQLRRALIDQAGDANRQAIDSALAMLDRAAASSPLLKRALERAGEI